MPVSGNDKEEAQRQEESRGEWRRSDTARRRGDMARSLLFTPCVL